MAKLSDGRELKPDFTKITVKEYRLLISPLAREIIRAGVLIAGVLLIFLIVCWI